MVWRALAFMSVVLAGCSALPRDPEKTSQHVRESRVIRVATTPEVKGSREAGDLLRRLEAATGARARPSQGGAEPVLAALEHGEYDLAIAWFDEKTPWATRVALAPALARRAAGDRKLELRAAVRNGENRWAMLVETTSRAIAPELAK